MKSFEPLLNPIQWLSSDLHRRFLINDNVIYNLQVHLWYYYSKGINTFFSAVVWSDFYRVCFPIGFLLRAVLYDKAKKWFYIVCVKVFDKLPYYWNVAETDNIGNFDDSHFHTVMALIVLLNIDFWSIYLALYTLSSSILLVLLLISTSISKSWNYL